MKIAVIWWTDSSIDATVNESFALSDELHPLNAVSAGVLLEASPDKEYVTIYRDLFKQPAGDTVRYRICIPKSAIEKMVVFDLEKSCSAFGATVYKDKKDG